ncbi:MAG: hypothetical protein SPI30_00265 [Prevotella sp.]|nr:hypothetical protein [Prevotella sp.]
MDTNHWYGVYQRAVRSVPVLGSMSTKHWYDDKTFPCRFPKRLMEVKPVASQKIRGRVVDGKRRCRWLRILSI